MKCPLFLNVLTALVLAASATNPTRADEATSTDGRGIPPTRTWLLHLPGISGDTGLDQTMLRGLRQGGYVGPVETYDWTRDNPGIPALLASKRNHEQAARIAELITSRFRSTSNASIILTSHSAGAGLCVWAMEDLPDDVKVDQVLLLSPALSPSYDLTKALTHVRGHAYAFTSPNDVAVLGLGTAVLGTVDGKYVAAAGRVGFTRPEGADDVQYRKLVPEPYRLAWRKLDNIGDHVGMMSAPFAQFILAPFVLKATLENPVTDGRNDKPDRTSRSNPHPSAMTPPSSN